MEATPDLVPGCFLLVVNNEFELCFFKLNLELLLAVRLGVAPGQRAQFQVTVVHR
jgi:hypothetical protein